MGQYKKKGNTLEPLIVVNAACLLQKITVNHFVELAQASREFHNITGEINESLLLRCVIQAKRLCGHLG